jgi:hypothetical protein
MSGRRSYTRFALSPHSEGVFRILRDVVVQQIDASEIIAISGEAAVIGESMMIDIPAHEATPALSVQVVDSRPIVVDGAVRHQLRLRKVVAANENAEQPPQK